jgi:hypothetical protein
MESIIKESLSTLNLPNVINSNEKNVKAVLYDCKIKAFQTEGFGRYFEL